MLNQLQANSVIFLQITEFFLSMERTLIRINNIQNQFSLIFTQKNNELSFLGTV